MNISGVQLKRPPGKLKLLFGKSSIPVNLTRIPATGMRNALHFRNHASIFVNSQVASIMSEYKAGYDRPIRNGYEPRQGGMRSRERFQFWRRSRESDQHNQTNFPRPREGSFFGLQFRISISPAVKNSLESTLVGSLLAKIVFWSGVFHLVLKFRLIIRIFRSFTLLEASFLLSSVLARIFRSIIRRSPAKGYRAY